MATFNKTTNIEFHKYGEVYTETTSKEYFDDSRSYVIVKDKNLEFLYFASEPIYFRVKEGAALVVITSDLSVEPESFAIHRVCKVNPGMYLRFVSITEEAIIDVFPRKELSKVKLPNNYTYHPLVSNIKVSQIVGNFYVVRGPDYIFPGEHHNYWELTYIDSGELITNVDGKEYVLGPQEFIFYAPGQIHTQTSKKSCSYLMVEFKMDIPDDDTRLLIDRKISIGQKQAEILTHFLKMSDDEKISYLSELLSSAIQMFVIVTLANLTNPSTLKRRSTSMQTNYHNEMISEIVLYINENIYSNITVEDLCYKFSLSRSTLQTLFNDNLNVGPKEYICNQKFSKAKQLIKESALSISEISDVCGFSSIHYFSRKFKERYGMTPTAYAKSI